jgi:alpha 1,2-mannosyltransferase
LVALLPSSTLLWPFPHLQAFSEVLLLDADNLPLQDPTFLFDAQPYASTGLLTWPDFWAPETQRRGWQVLGISRAQRPAHSHESGQLLLDKRRGWVPLLLAPHLNLRGDVHAPLLSTNGQGDKETWALAWLAAGRGSYGLMQHPVLALGTVMPDGGHAGSAMLQRGPDGLPLFLHAHMPKVDVPRVPPALHGMPGAPARS